MTVSGKDTIHIKIKTTANTLKNYVLFVGAVAIIFIITKIYRNSVNRRGVGRIYGNRKTVFKILRITVPFKFKTRGNRYGVFIVKRKSLSQYVFRHIGNRVIVK